MTEYAPRRRIDQWLFFTRLCKSRSLAGRLVEAGKIRINKEKISKPAHPVAIGNVITAMINHRLMVIEVLAIGQRRGPATEAIELYKDLTPVEEKKNRSDNKNFIANTPSRPKGLGRPTKKHRRQLDLLKQRSR